MFGPIGGIVPGFFPVGVGQLLLKAATRETFHIRHVGVITSGSRMVEAMPSGAREITLDPMKHWTPKHFYLRPNYTTHENQGLEVAEDARYRIGTPYSFLDYAAIADLHLGGRLGFVRNYVRDSGHMICSQLADQALTDAGFHVFDDGRLPQDVMPAELFSKLLSMPGTQVLNHTMGGWDFASSYRDWPAWR